MKAYLQRFFTEFAYEPEDAGFLLAAYDRVMSEPAAAVCWQEAIAIYDRDCNCDYSQVIGLADKAADATGLQPYTLELLIFICLSRKTEQLYIQRGLPLEIFHNSLLDLRYKLDECKVIYGFPGSFVAGWFARFFQLTRFAFGRLQFELIDFGESYEKNGHCLTPESKVINIHIPRTGTPLDPASCDEAFRQAKAFFAPELGDTVAFVCSSWLLFPEHERLLPPKSNIRKFMDRFEILHAQYYKDRSSLWRLFDTMELHPDKLPADTSMRRSYVAYLKEGGRLGGARGLFFL